MKRPRIIPVLLLQKGGLVKSIKFKSHIYIGDPINAVRIYNDLRVDEIALLDIDASRENRTIPIELVKEIGEEANMPFSVGGGIRDIETIKQIIQARCRKSGPQHKRVKRPSIYQGGKRCFRCVNDSGLCRL